MESSSGPIAPNPVLAWLQSEGVRFRETAELVDALANELLRAGVDIHRLTFGVPILHPQFDSSGYLWQRGKAVKENRFKLDQEGIQNFQNSPMAIVYGGRSFRSRLEAPPQIGEFPILTDLRKEGVTDYVAHTLPFSDGSWKAVTYATRRPGGFPQDHIAVLESLAPMLATIVEVQTLHRTTLTLLDTYVGPSAGRRVRDGAIKRGMCEAIEAVIWFCDLRGFTELSEDLPGNELVSLLNDYFGAMTDAVERHGGEVLKFIGDAVLAIFPLSGKEAPLVAGGALVAAQEAEEAIHTLNEQRSRAAQPLIRFGLALHVGEVLYGNIGGARRLDFTVIGHAVNVATRIESLCKTLKRSILLSSEFAHLCGNTSEPLGRFPLKGVGTEQPVYALSADPTVLSRGGF